MAGPRVVTLAALCARMTERQIVDGNLRVCRALEAFFQLSIRKCGMLEIASPDVPSWFEKCFESYWQTTWRTVPLDVNPEQPSPRHAGYFLGYVYWATNWFAALEKTAVKLPNLPFRKISK